jgi:carboxymethylenebutenolidase
MVTSKSSTQREGEYVTYRSADGKTDIRSYFARPASSGAYPAVLILRGMAGPDSGYTQIADQLAAEGFSALVHTWQARGDDPGDNELFADIQGALGFLQKNPKVDDSRLAVFGYCKGGGYGVLAAAEFPQIHAVVSFHGFAFRLKETDSAHTKHPVDVADRVRRPVLILHGEADDASPIDKMRTLANRLREGGSAVAFTSYAGAKHGFAVSTHPGYMESAAKSSFATAISFLRTHLTPKFQPPSST